MEAKVEQKFKEIDQSTTEMQRDLERNYIRKMQVKFQLDLA